jgi:hypothetical protein
MQARRGHLRKAAIGSLCSYDTERERGTELTVLGIAILRAATGWGLLIVERTSEQSLCASGWAKDTVAFAARYVLDGACFRGGGFGTACKSRICRLRVGYHSRFGARSAQYVDDEGCGRAGWRPRITAIGVHCGSGIPGRPIGLETRSPLPSLERLSSMLSENSLV